MLGLPDHVRACLFDLDGVLTETAVVHARAWKQMFDDYLRERAKREGAGAGAGDGVEFVPFDAVADYDEYVDGKPRADGTRAFLQSRGIDLPEGGPDDPPGEETVAGLGRRKNDLVLQMIRTDGVRAYPGSVRFVHAVREAGMPCAVVSSSANCADVLESAGIAELFDLRVDGVVAQEQHLAGKPAPDTYLAGARGLGQTPDRCAVFEDALAGVASGRAGAFGWVVGVDRVGQAAALREHGADVVVDDLADLLEQR